MSYYQATIQFGHFPNLERIEVLLASGKHFIGDSAGIGPPDGCMSTGGIMVKGPDQSLQATIFFHAQTSATSVMVYFLDKNKEIIATFNGDSIAHKTEFDGVGMWD
ncbi:hypothetical protein NK214_18465 [Chromobacterium sp. S0633]|uniref:hypothetical protein n=1 Tax=Chromobacterium sp. S0633 TaxID=2957805 RepID=UPI00209DFD08|nr:hypothetical protein [Chromobacterium sp. S0633]MCP1292172.1 hypothetical protein [Chromobacterium sp. S0633]